MKFSVAQKENLFQYAGILFLLIVFFCIGLFSASLCGAIN